MLGKVFVRKEQQKKLYCEKLEGYHPISEQAEALQQAKLSLIFYFD